MSIRSEMLATINSNPDVSLTDLIGESTDGKSAVELLDEIIDSCKSILPDEEND